MPHPKQISAQQILDSALELLETEGISQLSLRTLATRLGVKAPSLYRYFPDRASLEAALAATITQSLHAALAAVDPEHTADFALRNTAETYLAFARNRPNLYFFLMQNPALPPVDPEGKALWNLVLARVAAVSGHPDDTSAAVALWSFLHGFAALEHSGRFGPSGPQDAFLLGLEALIQRFRFPPDVRF
jgi:AcrR family transcriptional regulator